MLEKAIGSVTMAWDREAATVDGEVSVLLRTLDGAVAGRRADAPHYAASTIKLAVAVAATAAVARGDLDPTTEIIVRSRFPSRAGGTFTMRQGDDQDDLTWSRLRGTLPLSLLMERMLVESSNIATNLIIQELGFRQVREALAAAGAHGISFGRLIGDGPAEAAGLTNVVTADALARLLASLARGDLLPPDEGDALLRQAARQTYRRLVPAGLPDGTWSAGKAGWNDAVRHDVALVRPPHAPPYILAVCTTSRLGDLAERLVARISRITWDHWTASG